MDESLLHLGVEWHRLPSVWVQLQSHRASLLADRWDAWGEPLERTPFTPFAHIIVMGTASEHDELIATLVDDLCGEPHGTCIAAETAIDDWSIDEAGGRIWHRLESDDGTVVVVEVHPWAR